LTDGIALGPLLLRWNGLLIALGISFGALLAAIESKRRFQDAEIIYYLFVPVTVWAWIGSRLWHVFTPPLSSVQLGLTTSHYLSHPLDILSFWVGGFGIPGAILGGTFALWRASRKDELPFGEIADILAPGLLLAQAIGRVGNYFNQELYGLPTNMPWAIFIQPDHRLPGYENFELYHPLFAYEALLALGGVILLMWMLRSTFAQNLKAGDVYLVYMAYYSLIRFLLETLRLDVALVNGVNVNQVFFAILFIIAAGILGHRRLAPVL
jgi:phosphatidylglycerol:prolipoprotein diacylglycerol transferase